MENKEAITIFCFIHRWIYIYNVIDILQNDNRSKFKGLCLIHVINFDIQVINRRLRTLCKQDLVEQSNNIIKIKINV